eukprot:scaffold265074_cov28-Tisochrysis_lutea.AAC.2
MPSSTGYDPPLLTEFARADRFQGLWVQDPSGATMTGAILSTGGTRDASSHAITKGEKADTILGFYFQ